MATEYHGVVRGTRISDNWDLDGEVLVHYQRNLRYPAFWDSRACCEHETEVVHHGLHTETAVMALLVKNAEPEDIASAIRRAYIERESQAWFLATPPSPPVAAVLSHGREVRMVDGMYEVQPRSDNYWRKFDRLDDAIAFGEGTTSITGSEE